MTEHKFTKGPWRWTKAYQTSDGRETWTLVSDAYVYGILTCDGVENSPQGLNDFGNARLIESALDLFEALKQIKHSIQQARIPGNDWKRELALIENTVDAAIAKATGHD